MILDIVKYGHPALREKGKPVTRIDAELREFAANLLETMYAANGVGLAAQQVGRPLQLCVIDVKDAEERPSKMWIDGEETDVNAHMPMTVINPKLQLVTPTETGVEGCLSFPEISANITRPGRTKATITRLDGSKLTFECDGLLSRALQHETDHLNGILFIDRMKPGIRTALRGDIARLKRETEREMKRVG